MLPHSTLVCLHYSCCFHCGLAPHFSLLNRSHRCPLRPLLSATSTDEPSFIFRTVTKDSTSTTVSCALAPGLLILPELQGERILEAESTCLEFFVTLLPKSLESISSHIAQKLASSSSTSLETTKLTKLVYKRRKQPKLAQQL